jgi:hypothetical protein
MTAGQIERVRVAVAARSFRSWTRGLLARPSCPLYYRRQAQCAAHARAALAGARGRGVASPAGLTATLAAAE